MSTTIPTPEKLAFQYTFIEQLGEGANGKTWLAIDRRTSQKVAIKELKLNAAENDEFKSLELFKREAELLKSIQVSGVPRFYDSILSNNLVEPSYIIQEYINYPSIQDLLDKGYIFTEKETLALLKKIATILFALQTRYTPPIIHRDIKPSNILIRKEKEIKEAYLIDFGAVANPQKRSGGSTIAGTFGYMAPEQMLGNVFIQSDYYALGATALHMMTGVSPYNIPSDVFNLQYEPVLHEKAPQTSNVMYKLLKTLLAPEVSERPKDAQLLLDSIINVQNGKSPDYVNKKSELIQYDTLANLDNKFRLWLNNNNKNNKEDLISTPNDTWITTSAKLYAQRLIQDPVLGCIDVFEYAFEAGGRLWCGYVSPNNPSIQICPIKQFPTDCKIQYNPEDPRISWCIDIVKK